VPWKVSAQTGTLVGTVTDAQSRGPVSGAVIALEGTDRTGASRADGRFVFDAVPSGNQVVRGERIGYRPVRRTSVIVPGTTATLDILLTPEPFSLDELVVTGSAGPVPQRDVGNSSVRLEIDELTDRPATLSDFLQGAAAGIE